MDTVIKKGTSGKQIYAKIIIWHGIAEINIENVEPTILPAALFVDIYGRDVAAIALKGNKFDQNVWWDARIFRTRGWENDDLSTISNELSTRIDDALKINPNDIKWKMTEAEITARISMGKYHII